MDGQAELWRSPKENFAASGLAKKVFMMMYESPL
jgi:hypothetical protein